VRPFSKQLRRESGQFSDELGKPSKTKNSVSFGTPRRRWQAIVWLWKNLYADLFKHAYWSTEDTLREDDIYFFKMFNISVLTRDTLCCI
jgi:hypothetical protein